MAVRTIKVDITGLKDIEKAQKSVSALRDSVLDFEKQLQKLSGKGNSPLSFNVKLEMNTDKALKDYLSLKKQIESLPITNTTKSSVTSNNGDYSKSSTNPNTIPNNNGYIRVRDQDYKSWLNLNSAINNVTSSTIGLASQMAKLGAVTPAKGLLSVFTSINRSVLDTQKNLMGLVGNGITGSLRGGFSTITSSAKTGFDGLVKEAETLGDAMQVYRINMQALGVDDKDVNKSIKRLGDYGKATVFDASDLLEQASIYSSYGRTDSEQIVKGYAGLLAQTKNPKEGMKTVTEQTSQMLASGVLNQQDYKFIRQRLSALGASRLNAELQKLAESKGESSIIDATRKRKISADEYLDIVNKLGNSDDFQKLVNSIVTPKQAMENLKETLSNLLVYDKIDDEGNSTPGALNRVYVATRDFIKGITDIVSSNRFEGYVKSLGDSIGNTIQRINTFGSAWRLAFGQKFIESVSNFAKGFNEGVSGLDVGSTLFKTTKTLFEVLNNSGKSIGEFTKHITTSAFELVDALARVAQSGINGGFLNAISGIVDIYKNIANLAVDSGFVSGYASVLEQLTNAINNTIKAVNVETAQSVVKSLREFITATISLVEGITTKTTLIDSLASVFQSALGALTEIINSIGELGAGKANLALASLRDAVIGIINGIKPLLVELAQGAVIALASNSGKNFFNAVQGFVQAVVGAIKNTLVSLGGSVDGGLRKLLDFLTMAVNFASGIATLLGGVGKYLLIGFIGTKFVAWATNIITSLQTVATAMSSVTGGRINPLKLGGNFSKQNLVRQGMSSYDIDVAYSGMSRANKNAIPMNMSRTNRAKANSRMVKGNIALLGADIATGMINSAVQNNKDASQGTKDFTNVLASTASWAYTGAFLGSFIPGGTLIGAGIGAVAGFGMGLWDNHKKAEDRKRLEEQANKESQQLKKEQGEQALAYIKDLGKQVSEVQGNFFAQLGNGENGLQLASAFVDSLTTLSNGDLNTGKRSVGLNTQAVPKGIENYFVELNGKLVKWADLKSQTGLSDEKLLATIEQLYSALGRPFVEFKDEAGTVIETVNTLTKGEQARRDRNLQSYKDNLAKLGLSYKEGSTPTFGDISALDSKLSSSLEGSNFANSEDQKNAILSSLKEVGLNIEGIRGYTLEQLKELATNLRKGATTLGKSAKEENTSKIDAIKKEAENHGGVISEDTAKKLDSMNGEELDKYLKDLHSTNLMTHNVTDEQRSHKVAEFREKLEELGKTVNLETGKFIYKGLDLNSKEYENLYTTLSDKTAFVDTIKKSEEKAREVLTNMGITSVDLQNKILEKIVNGSATSFKDAIEKVAQETQQEAPQEKYSIVATDLYNIVGKFVKDGTIPLEKAKEILKGYDPASVDTSKLDTNGQELYNNVSGTMESTANKLQEGSDKAKVPMQEVPTEQVEEAKGGFVEALKGIWDAVVSVYNSARDFISGLFTGGNNKPESQKQGFIPAFSTGGIIPEYHSQGLGVGWKSRGTDTVPAMLTPGEYVLRKKAVDSLGLGFLNNLNKFGSNMLQTMNKSTIINNIYNTNNAKISQNIDNKSQYLNGMYGVDKLMRYV